MTTPTGDFFQGGTRALARALSTVENVSPEGSALLQRVFPYTGRARVIGVTGSPGVGKSSLVDRLAAAYRATSPLVGILAVDPSSPFSGGAILGDRIRMHTLSTDPGVFIRSMATRGHLGGLAAATAGAIRILDAAARDPILVETVGTGQDEIDIARIADVCVVVLVPGMGDDIQAMKAGIMEIGDIFVINKCDRPGVEKMEHALLALLSLAHRADGWVPPVVKTVATEGRGTDDLTRNIDNYIEHFRNSEHRMAKARESARHQLQSLLRERLLQKVLNSLPEELNGLLDRIARHEEDPYATVERMLGPGTKIEHIGIAVRSIPEALKLYEDILELKVSAVEEVAEQGVRVAMLPLGDSRIELLEPLGADSPVEKFLSRRGEGIHHIAVCVDNIELALERFKAAGKRLIDAAPRRGAQESKIAFIHPSGTHGVLLELVEHEK